MEKGVCECTGIAAPHGAGWHQQEPFSFLTTPELRYRGPGEDDFLVMHCLGLAVVQLTAIVILTPEQIHHVKVCGP